MIFILWAILIAEFCICCALLWVNKRAINLCSELNEQNAYLIEANRQLRLEVSKGV